MSWFHKVKSYLLEIIQRLLELELVGLSVGGLGRDGRWMGEGIIHL